MVTEENNLTRNRSRPNWNRKLFGIIGIREIKTTENRTLEQTVFLIFLP